MAGRKIVAVRQRRFWNAHTSAFVFELTAIELDNGTTIALSATETGTDCVVRASITPTNAEGTEQ